MFLFGFVLLLFFGVVFFFCGCFGMHFFRIFEKMGINFHRMEWKLYMIFHVRYCYQ